MEKETINEKSNNQEFDEKPKPQTIQCQQNQDEQINQETLEQFNKISIQATQLMNAYKSQTEELKTQIIGMVSVYNQNAKPEQAVPIQKIVQITNGYQIGMKQAQLEYSYLSDQLKKQSHERDQMMLQIQQCFNKLEKMEVKMKQKQLLKKEANQNKKQQLTLIHQTKSNSLANNEAQHDNLIQENTTQQFKVGLISKNEEPTTKI